MERHYFIMFQGNWADEMDVIGYSILNEADTNRLKDELKKYKDQITLYVGTNEEIDFKNGEELMKHLTIKEITNDEMNVIKKFIGNKGGTFDIEEEIFYNIE